MPAAFGNWRIDSSVIPVQANPEVPEKNLTPSTKQRLPVPTSTMPERVMLSIAYGSDQTGRLRVHRPESCYNAQGFAVKTARTEKLPIKGGIEAKRLIATAGPRHEPYYLLDSGW